jgi:hypothetical protein
MSDHYKSDENESGSDINADNDLSIAFAQVWVSEQEIAIIFGLRYQ